MKIRVITGQQGVNIFEVYNEFAGNIIKFPETKTCHSYDLCEHVMRIVQDHFESDSDVDIVTYSEVVLDAVRLWVARNKFEGAECINVLLDGNCINVSIDKYGEMETWVNGVFDIKQVILKELFEIRKERSIN